MIRSHFRDGSYAQEEWAQDVFFLECRGGVMGAVCWTPLEETRHTEKPGLEVESAAFTGGEVGDQLGEVFRDT